MKRNAFPVFGSGLPAGGLMAIHGEPGVKADTR